MLLLTLVHLQQMILNKNNERTLSIMLVIELLENKSKTAITQKTLRIYANFYQKRNIETATQHMVIFGRY